MKMKYQRGGRAGKLHNMAMRMRKNKPERYNPLKEQALKMQFMEQMKLLAAQAKLEQESSPEFEEDPETQLEAQELVNDKTEKDTTNE